MYITATSVILLSKGGIIMNNNYIKPLVKKLVLELPKPTTKRLFMGCYQYSYVANDGDGC